MPRTSQDPSLLVIESLGLVRPRDLAAHGITRARLGRLVREGLVVRLGRDIYVSARHAPTERHSLAQAANRAPEGVFCLLTARRFSGEALTAGIEEHVVEGVTRRVYSPAKTVADCFKYRNKIGIDVAVAALRDFSRKHRGQATELARCARICRVARVMQPYLDAVW